MSSLFKYNSQLNLKPAQIPIPPGIEGPYASVLLHLDIIFFVTLDCRAISMGQGQEVHARKLVGSFMQTVSVLSKLYISIFLLM
jgi:hypothetical protein